MHRGSPGFREMSPVTRGRELDVRGRRPRRRRDLQRTIANPYRLYVERNVPAMHRFQNAIELFSTPSVPAYLKSNCKRERSP